MLVCEQVRDCNRQFAINESDTGFTVVNLVTIYNARNGFRVIVNLDDFNSAERATANSQLPTAFRGIIILYAAANPRGSHARQREANAHEAT